MSMKGIGITMKIVGAIIGAGGTILINRTEILKALELIRKTIS